MIETWLITFEQWSMAPWLPMGGGLLLVLGFAIVASYLWISRPSGASSLKRRGFFARNRSLLVLCWPLLIFIGFSQILMPIAPPEIVVLRSRAVGVGASVNPSGEALRCFKAITEALVQQKISQPDCLKTVLSDGIDGSAESTALLKKVELEISKTESEISLASGVKFPGQTDIVLGSPQLSDTVETALDNASVTGQMTRFRVKQSLRYNRHWWQSVKNTRPIDAGPVVDRAVKYFDPSSFTPQDYVDLDPKLSHALRSAALRAVREVPPPSLAGDASCADTASDSPGCAPARLDTPPAAVEALEVAVIRLLVAQRNVRGALVETHPRRDEPLERNRWNRLSLVLLEGMQTGSGTGLGLINIPGSEQSAEKLIKIVGDPWMRQVDTGGIVYAQLRFGANPDTEVSFSLINNDTGKAVEFFCASGATVKATQHRLASCFGSRSLKKGDAVLLRLQLDAIASNSLSLNISFPGSLGVRSINHKILTDTNVEAIAINAVSSLGATALSSKLDKTLGCLLAQSPLSGLNPSYTRDEYFPSLLNTEGRPRLVKGSGGVIATIIEEPSDLHGLWIYPSTMSFARIEGSLEPIITQRRPIPIDHRIGMEGGLLEGSSLFPVALTGRAPVNKVMPLWYTPLKPKRAQPLIPGQDPDLGLQLPQSSVINASFAKPVYFSAIPTIDQKEPLGINLETVAPIAWRINLPPNAVGDSESLIWYFNIDVVAQGLLLRNDCTPEPIPDYRAFCSATDPVTMQSYEPHYEEARFIPMWLSILEAAREVGFNIKTPSSIKPELQAPDFIEPWMVARSRVASAFPGLMLIAIGVLGYAIFLLVLRFRQRDH